MGIHHENGYSADVEGYFVVNGDRIRVAKSNECSFVVVEPRELPPGIEGDLLVIVDGDSDSRRVLLPQGMQLGQNRVPYEVSVPF
jgi:hypothetical protein